MFQLPDPASLIPADWRKRSDKEKRAIYAEAWATLGANIAFLNDEAKRPKWEQLVLPLEYFLTQTYTCASGWCAPSEPEYSIYGGQ